jgi:hypothetical protein
VVGFPIRQVENDCNPEIRDSNKQTDQASSMERFRRDLNQQSASRFRSFFS